MPRLLSLLALLVAPAVAHAAPSEPTTASLTPSALPATQKAALSRLTSEWKSFFRSIRTLDYQWKMSGTFAFQPGVRHTYFYHFTREPSRHRLDTTFYSSKPNQGDAQKSTTLYEAKFFKSWTQRRSGFSDLSVRPYAQRKLNPYDSVIPLFEPFTWALDSTSALKLEEFGSDAFWNRLESRVQKVEQGSWENRRGWWLDVAREVARPDGSKSTRNLRVFVDETTLFPFFTSGKVHFTSKDSARDSTYNFQVTKTQQWMSDGKKWLLPARWVSRSWEHNLGTGKRTQESTTEEITAPVQINQFVAPQRWIFTPPNETLVRFAAREGIDMMHETTFTFNKDAGSLWQQEKTSIERREKRLRELEADAIYDQKADGEAQIAEALTLAKAGNKGVLLQFGANWCAPCHVLHKLLQSDATLAPLVAENFVIVSIDLNEGHNENVANRLMGANQGGLPFIVILKSDGERLAAPPSEFFNASKTDDTFDVKKIADFLKFWKTQL